MSQSEAPLTFDYVFSEHYLRSVYKNRLSKATFVGLDGISVSSFNKSLDQEVALISRKVLDGSYQFTRYREKLILKSAGRPPRQISVPTVRDALALRALSDLLNYQFQEYKPAPPHDCTKRVYLAAKQACYNDYFLRLDIVNFYPSVQHNTLFEQLNSKGAEKRTISLITKAVGNPTGFDGDYNMGVGVPQGLSISNLLSMIYLSDFDSKFKNKYVYFRYVDDIILIVRRDKIKDIHSEVSEYLESELKLKIHELDSDHSNKAAVMSINKGVEYLGYKISKGKLRIRDRSYKKMFRVIVGCLRRIKGGAQSDRIIWRLNLIITGCRIEKRSVGWVFFFRQSTDASQFHRMDVFVQGQLRKYGLKDYVPAVKKFAKSYYEIRYNRDKTTYVPNFDHFTIDDMKMAMTLMGEIPTEKLVVMKKQEIKKCFWKMTKREAAKLERETIDFESYFS